MPWVRPPINLIDPITHLPPPRRDTDTTGSSEPWSTKQVIIVSVVISITVPLFCVVIFVLVKKLHASRLRRAGARHPRPLWTQPERGVFPQAPLRPALTGIPELRARDNADIEMGLVSPTQARPKNPRGLQINVPPSRPFPTVGDYIHQRGEFAPKSTGVKDLELVNAQRTRLKPLRLVAVQNAGSPRTSTPGGSPRTATAPGTPNAAGFLRATAYTPSDAGVAIRDSLNTISTLASLGEGRVVDVTSPSSPAEVVDVKTPTKPF